MRRSFWSVLAFLMVIELWVPMSRCDAVANTNTSQIPIQGAVFEWQAVSPTSVRIAVVESANNTVLSITPQVAPFQVSSNSGLTVSLSCPLAIQLTAPNHNTLSCSVDLEAAGAGTFQRNTSGSTQTVYMKGLAGLNVYNLTMALSVPNPTGGAGTYTGTATVTLAQANWPGTGAR